MTTDFFFTGEQLERIEMNALKALIAQKDERIASDLEEIERLKGIILAYKRQLYGPKKERWLEQEQASLVFNEAEKEAANPEDNESTQGSDEQARCEENGTKVEAHVRKRGKRKPLPENLPRRVVTIELPESERVAEDGTPLKVIGKETSEKLVYEPAKVEVIVYERLRYGVDSGDPVKTAPPVPAIIPKGIATPSLLSGIITHKYADGLPLYRQEEIFKRAQVELSRGSMARWIILCATACMPIWNVLEERLLSSKYVSCDETFTQVLKEKGRSAESQSWMWARSTPADKQKIVLFDYDPHRSGNVAKRLLADFRGYLQVDGYSAYNWAQKVSEIIRLGCNMHGRRGFEEAYKLGSKSGRSLAEQGLKYYKRLYKIEEEAKEKGMNEAERFAYRLKHAVPIWKEMKAWAEASAPKIPPKSKIGEAFHYFLGQLELLMGYLQHGSLEPDNGFVERAIRKFGIGRNNWLFSDTVEGAQASALFYSFIVTAKLNGVNPYRALTRIFELVPLARSVDDYERLADLLLSPDASA